MDTVILALRVLLSLAVVLGLLWVLQRRLTRGARTGATAKLLTVVARQGIGAKASVVVLDADGRRFVLGVTEHSVNVLHSTEAPAEAVAGAAGEPVKIPVAGATTAAAAAIPAETVVRPEAAGAAAFARAMADAGAPHTGRRAARSASRAHMGRRSRAGSTPAGSSPAKSSPAKSSPAKSTPAGSLLAGSILSPATWKQTAAALRQGRNG